MRTPPPSLRIEALRELAEAADLVATARHKILRAQSIHAQAGHHRSIFLRHAQDLATHRERLHALWLEDAAAVGFDERHALAQGPTTPAPDDEDCDRLGCR